MIKIKEDQILKSKFFSALLKLIDKSTFHGIPNIVRAESVYSRFFWIFFTLLSSAACVYYIKDNLDNFLNFNYVTNVDVIYEQPMQFPAISICSCSNSTLNTPLKSLIIKCLFNNDKKCQTNPEKTFEKFYDPSYKQCYRFNSGKNMTGGSIDIFNTNMAGRSAGLQFEMYETNGLLLFIHNQSMPPYLNENYNNLNGYSIFVSTGFSTDLVIFLLNFSYRFYFYFNFNF